MPCACRAAETQASYRTLAVIRRAVRSSLLPPRYPGRHGTQHLPRSQIHQLGLLPTKLWKLNERFKLQFRGEFFNILNHANFDVFTMNNDLSIPSNVGTVVFTPDVASSNPVIGSGGSRHIQLGAKVLW